MRRAIGRRDLLHRLLMRRGSAVEIRQTWLSGVRCMTACFVALRIGRTSIAIQPRRTRCRLAVATDAGKIMRCLHRQRTPLKQTFDRLHRNATENFAG